MIDLERSVNDLLASRAPSRVIDMIYRQSLSYVRAHVVDGVYRGEPWVLRVVNNIDMERVYGKK